MRYPCEKMHSYDHSYVSEFFTNHWKNLDLIHPTACVTSAIFNSFEPETNSLN